MANKTDTSIPTELSIIYVLWFMQFVLIGTSDGIIALSILRYKALRKRKEFLIIFGLSLADFGLLASLGCAAIYRLYISQTGQFYTKQSPSDCILQPQIMGWAIFEGTSSIMLVVVSLDRWIAVSFPVKYYKLGKSYAYRMLGSVYGFCFLMGLMAPAICVDYADHLVVDAGCFYIQVLTAGKSSALKWLLIMYYSYIVPVMGSLSVLLYIGVAIVFYKKQHQSVEPSNNTNRNSQQSKDRDLQRRLTETLAISTTCTFTFVVLPILFANTADIFATFPRIVLQAVWLLPQVNPLCNLLIYYTRQEELRKGIKAMLRNKKMPSNLAAWKNMKSRAGAKITRQE